VTIPLASVSAAIMFLITSRMATPARELGT
jgi:hypothetical protein